MKKGFIFFFFTHIGKKSAYFFPNRLNIYKIAKKGWQFFACGAHPLIIINIIWGKHLNQEGRRGGGKNMNLNSNLHPWNYHKKYLFEDSCALETHLRRINLRQLELCLLLCCLRPYMADLWTFGSRLADSWGVNKNQLKGHCSYVTYIVGNRQKKT